MSEKIVIDCNAVPSCPEGWTIMKHEKRGKFKWNPEKVRLYLDKRQKGDYIAGDSLQKRLEKKKTANANVFDYLSENLELIPKEWEKENIRLLFWGTIYRHSQGASFIRCLTFEQGKWIGGIIGTGRAFDSTDPAVVLN